MTKSFWWGSNKMIGKGKVGKAYYEKGAQWYENLLFLRLQFGNVREQGRSKMQNHR